MALHGGGDALKPCHAYVATTPFGDTILIIEDTALNLGRQRELAEQIAAAWNKRAIGGTDE